MAESQVKESGPKKDGKTVVIAVDGSEFSDYALQFYLDSLHRPDNNVIIAHCTEYKFITYPAVAVVSGDTAMSMVTKEIKEEEDKTTVLIDRLTEKLNNLKINHAMERVHGEPGPAILTLTHSKNADYVVVGCRGKSAVRKTFTGSVTDYITHHSHVPVVVARHKDHLEKHGLHLHIPFHHQKSKEKHGGNEPKSPTSPASPTSS